MQDPHTPRDGFVERLEWQISSELRRRHRTGPATWLPSSPLKAAAAIASLVLVSMGIGGAAVAAAVQAQNNERRDLLASGYERRLELARQRRTLALQHADRVDGDVSIGARRREDWLDARLNVVEAERVLRVLELQLQEVRATGREPLSEVSAPVVSGRDFVMERLQADLTAAEAALGVERERLRDVRSRVKVGVANPTDVAQIETRVQEVEAALTGLKLKLDIRRRFVGGQVSATQAELRVLEGDAEQRVTVLEPKIALARKQIMAAEARFNVGLATHVQVAEARLHLSELEADLAKAQLDLALIRKKINEPS